MIFYFLKLLLWFPRTTSFSHSHINPLLRFSLATSSPTTLSSFIEFPPCAQFLAYTLAILQPRISLHPFEFILSPLWHWDPTLIVPRSAPHPDDLRSPIDLVNLPTMTTTNGSMSVNIWEAFRQTHEKSVNPACTIWCLYIDMHPCHIQSTALPTSELFISWYTRSEVQKHNLRDWSFLTIVQTLLLSLKLILKLKKF